jgi:hypothetical protein
MEKRYAKQIIEWAEEAKQYLTIRKEIIIDESVTDEKLGNIIRMMYKYMSIQGLCQLFCICPRQQM